MPSHTEKERLKKIGSFITKPVLSGNPTTPTPKRPPTQAGRRLAAEKAVGITRKPTEKQEKLRRFLRIFGIKF